MIQSVQRRFRRDNGRPRWWVGGVLLVMVPASCAQADKPGKFRGRLGPDSRKIRRENGKTYLWAGGSFTAKGGQWYDFTDALIPAKDLQFGIGKDRIRAIDDPHFVPPDDPRLNRLPPSPYRKHDRRTIDDLQVIGVVQGKEARAYPVALLDYHELVNDHIGGKPVTVGW